MTDVMACHDGAPVFFVTPGTGVEQRLMFDWHSDDSDGEHYNDNGAQV